MLNLTSNFDPASICTFTCSNPNDLPPGRRRTRSVLLIQEVQEIARLLRAGIEDHGGVGLKLKLEGRNKHEVKQRSRILRDHFEGMIKTENVVTKSGKPLGVGRYTTDDNHECICVLELEDMLKRPWMCRKRRKTHDA